MKSPRKKSEPTFSVSEFKAKALTELEKVHHSGQPITITKRGRPIARVVPIHDSHSAPSKPGQLSHLLVHVDDIETPFGAHLWSAADDGEPQE